MIPPSLPVISDVISVDMLTPIESSSPPKFKFASLHERAIIPTVATSGSCGHDFFSIEEKEIPPLSIEAIRTGITAYFPPTYALFLKSRSGLVKNHGITTEGGVIDSDYCGQEILILLHNTHPSKPYLVKAGDKISQGVFVQVHVIHDQRPAPIIVEKAQREGGFGSTGY